MNPEIQQVKNEVSLHRHNGVGSQRINLSDIQGLIRTVSVIPTHTPRNIFEQFIIYVNGTTKRLYVYDASGKTWIKLTGTTVAKSGGTAWEGDVILGDGAGVTLTESPQTITFSAP